MEEKQVTELSDATLEKIAELGATIPPKGTEETPIEERNVICKLFLRGKPTHLKNSLDVVLNTVIPTNSYGQYASIQNQEEYIVTFLLEKPIKK